MFSIKFARFKLFIFYFILWFIVSISFASAQTIFTLSTAIDSGKANNASLKAEYLNVGISQADVITSRIRPNPVLNNQTLQLTNQNLFAEKTNWYSAKNEQIWWQLTKHIQWPAQRKFKIQFADETLTAANNRYNDAVRNLCFTIGTSFINCWYLKNKLNLLSSTKTKIDSFLQSNKFNNKINATDTARIKILSDEYNLQYSVSFQQYNNELANLKLLTGNADSIAINTDDNIETIIPPGNLNTLLKKASESRSDVELARTTINATATNVKLQKSLVWPQPELGFIYNPQNTIPYFGFFGTIEIPIFNRNQGEIKKSNFLKQQAEEELAATQLQAATDVSTAYSTYEIEKKNLQKYEGILKQSKQIFDDIEMKYLKGNTTILDFLDAQKNWFDTKQFYFDALKSYHESYLQLLFVTGLIAEL
ncbi:MAG: TolC family protein [Chitinophagaceae bacterium]